MNQLLKPATALLLLYCCSVTAAAQDSRTTSSSSLLYQSVNKPAIIAEDHETLEKTIPSITPKRTKPARAGIKVKPAADNDEDKVFVENRNLLDKAVLTTANSNPSATADYCTSPSVIKQGCCNYWIKDNIANKDEL